MSVGTRPDPTGPLRTCVACRDVRPKRELVRLVRGADRRVVVDPTGAAPGRGAYLCRRASCVDGGLTRRQLGHAFRGSWEAGADLAEEVRALWQQR